MNRTHHYRKLNTFNMGRIEEGVKATATPIRLCRDVRPGVSLLINGFNLKCEVEAVKFMKLNEATLLLLGYECPMLFHADWAKRFLPIDEHSTVRVLLFKQ